MKKRAANEAGFTLIEVLAAFVILSVVALAMTSFFTNALSYAKGNQNKTVMINLARNTLFYMEKQNFETIKAYFDNPENKKISCDATSCSLELQKLVSNGDQLFAILNPVVNGITYKIEIEYQENLKEDLGEKMSNYLLPINVQVEPVEGGRNKREVTMVEGYITNEKIR
ncbi:type IV pilus modification PilV family protein [Paenibacillus castaneae]|nr:prepilin-type N-terminal cleavage/methylation domain-containing protein [Paenibacillus castaneae]